MKKNIKLISLVVTAILLVGAVIGISVSAADDGQAIRIAGQNIAYEGAPQILYLVETKNELAEGETVKLVYSETAFDALDAGAALPEGAVLKTVPTDSEGNPLTVVANGKNYYPLFSSGIAPQNSAKAVYACPVIVDAEDNIVLAGSVVSYDVRQYARNRFAKSATDAQVALYTALLDYAASIQEVMYTDGEIAANGGYADAYIYTTFNKTVNGNVVETTKAYNRPGDTITTGKYLNDYEVFGGFTDANGVAIEADRVASNFGTVAFDGEDVLVTVNANYESDKNYGEYLTYEDNIDSSISNGTRFGHGVDFVSATWVSYLYKGTVYKYPTVTTLTEADEANGWAVGDKILTAGEEQVRVYDATAAADVAISVDAYNALSDADKATALVKIETLVSYNGANSKVAYAEQAESYDGTNALKITHAPFALETTLAFNEGELLDYATEVLKAQYSYAIVKASNNSSYFETAGRTYVFETDFNYLQHDTVSHPFQFLLRSTGGTVLGIGVCNVDSDGTFDLASVGLNDEGDTVIRQYIAMDIKMGEWNNIRIELVADDTAEYGIVAKAYVNGKLANTLTKTYAGSDASALAVDLQQVNITMTSSSAKEVMLDNTFVATVGTLIDHGLYSDNALTKDYEDFELGKVSNADVSWSSIGSNGTKSNAYVMMSEINGDNMFEYGHTDSKVASSTVTFKPVYSNGEKYVFEADLNIPYAECYRVNSSNWGLKFMLADSESTDSNVTIYVTEKNSTYTIQGKSAAAGGGSTVRKTLNMDTWYKIRVEYDPSVSNTPMLYINGAFVAYFGKALSATTTINGFCASNRANTSNSSRNAWINYSILFDDVYSNMIITDTESYTDFDPSATDAQFTVTGNDKMNNVLNGTNSNAYVNVVNYDGNDVLEYGHTAGKYAYSGVNINTTDKEGNLLVLETDFNFLRANASVNTEYVFQIVLNNAGTNLSGAVNNHCIYVNDDNTHFSFDNNDRDVFEMDKWYKLRVELNKADKKFSIYINDVLVVHKIANSVECDGMQFAARNSSSGGKITDFAILFDNTHCSWQ